MPLLRFGLLGHLGVDRWATETSWRHLVLLCDLKVRSLAVDLNNAPLGFASSRLDGHWQTFGGRVRGDVINRGFNT